MGHYASDLTPDPSPCPHCGEMMKVEVGSSWCPCDGWQIEHATLQGHFIASRLGLKDELKRINEIWERRGWI